MLELTIALCIALLFAAGVVALMTWRARRQYPPLGKFVECDGVRLHYIERGKLNGPAVLLLHGNGALIQEQTISGLVDLLAAKYRVLCFDRPGYGHSTRPRLRLWSPERQADLLAKALDQSQSPTRNGLGSLLGHASRHRACGALASTCARIGTRVRLLFSHKESGRVADVAFSHPRHWGSLSIHPWPASRSPRCLQG